MKYLAIDVGEKKIGLATSDELGILATPFKTISRENAFVNLGEIVVSEKIEKIIVGIPYLESGKLGSQAGDVWNFIEDLRGRFEIEIDYENENLSSKEAENRLREKKKKSKEDIDSMAAAVILETYLERTKDV